jgi:flagellum-specific ATP synthase
VNTLIDQLARILPARIEGRILQTTGVTVAVADFPVPLGAQVEIDSYLGGRLSAEVIGFTEDATLLYPLNTMTGVRRGDRVRLRYSTDWLAVGQQLLGRIVDVNGYPIDGGPPLARVDRIPRNRNAPAAVSRPTIEKPFSTGIRAIDGLLTCGQGQRMGIFSGAGAGKSTMIGMLARQSDADVNVIALIGERGREVNEFVQRELGTEGLAKSVIVVATSDQPAPMRLRAASTATAIAEYFRDQQKNVLLLMDSITRIAMAQREIGIAAGEPPTTRGCPPSVFALLPKLIERAGRSKEGNITAFYNVLVEGNDPQEPISDALRGLLDGQIWLSQDLAARGHYPAIDILQSVSRLSLILMSEDQQAAATKFRTLLANYREYAELISMGAYRQGTNPDVDEALRFHETMDQYLCQSSRIACSFRSARDELLSLLPQDSTSSRRPREGDGPMELQ